VRMKLLAIVLGLSVLSEAHAPMIVGSSSTGGEFGVERSLVTNLSGGERWCFSAKGYIALG
jgi:hypothetical protein